LIQTLSPTFIELDVNSPLEKVIDSIESLGYHAGNTLQFSLQGLNCGNCVNKLTKHLQTFDDIARLNVSKESLSLITSSSHEEIINRVAEVGYQATLINAPQVDEEEQIEVTADEPTQQEKIAEPKVATES